MPKNHIDANNPTHYPTTLISYITEQIERLKGRNVASDSLYARVYETYHQNVLVELNNILDHDNLTPSLKTFLAGNWALINGTSLSYTALPDDHLTDLLIKIAQFIHDENPSGPSALQLLIPTLVVDSAHNDYPSLDTLDIHEVLTTHILGREGKYLIPVRQLLSLLDTSRNEWFNWYFNYKVHEDSLAVLNSEEYERLGNHSSYTTAVMETKAYYDSHLQQQGSLLFHLHQLCRQLLINSTEGLGEETNAGTTVYDAIIHFNSYYHHLCSTSEHLIPSTVKDEIELLLNISSDPSLNTDATSNLATCLATRGHTLLAAMQPVEQALAQIGLSKETVDNLTEIKKQELMACKKELNDALAQNRCHGWDKLGLTLELISALNLEFSITSLAHVKALAGLKPTEFASIIGDSTIQQHIINQFDSVETLVLFIHEISIPALQILLTYCGPNLLDQVINEPKDLIAVVISLDAERCQLLCDAMREQFLKCITELYDLKSLLTPLAPEELKIVCDAMKDQFPLIIENSYSFSRLIKKLSSEQQVILVALMKNQLAPLFKTNDDFKCVIQYLAPEPKAIVVELMKGQLSHDIKANFIKSIPDFCRVIIQLTPRQQTITIELMKDHLLQLIKTSANFKVVSEFLAPEQQAIVVKLMKNHLAQLINSSSDFSLVILNLSSELRTTVLEVMLEELPNISNNAIELGDLIKYLSADHIKMVFKRLTAQLPHIIKERDDLDALLDFLTPEQSTVVLEIMGEELPEIINAHVTSVETGQWSCNFFKTPDQVETENQQVFLSTEYKR